MFNLICGSLRKEIIKLNKNLVESAMSDFHQFVKNINFYI